MGKKMMSRLLAVVMALSLIATSGLAVFAADSPTSGDLTGKVGKVTSVSSTGAQNGKSIKISWKATGNADKYIVKVGKITKEVTGTSTTVKVNANAKYKITVTPVFGDEKGTAKAGALRWTKTTKITKAKAGKKKVTLTWKKVKGATSYQVLMYKGGAWKVVKKSVKGTKATIKVAKKGSYKFKVRPMKGKYVGIRSNAKTGKAK